MKPVEKIKKKFAPYKEELKNRYKIKSLSVFGSYVRNQQKKNSDIDILVDFYEVPDLLKFIEIERYLENILDMKVDLVPKPALRIELRDKILSETVEI